MVKRNEQGFTLVEVLISLAIFAFGILAVINMQLLSTSINVKSRGMTEGIVTAQNKIEELSALPYTDALLTDRTTGANVGGIGAAGLDDFPATDADVDNADHSDFTAPRYSIFWNVEDDTPFTDTKTIRVIVRWVDKGVFQNFSIDMVKSNGA
jgi:prepilin-type N-terminal cleavage/methylation domain-containing protein